MSVVTFENLETLFQKSVKKEYCATDNDTVIDQIQTKCEALIGKDYNYCIINNDSGELALSYPARIILLENEKNNSGSDALNISHCNYKPDELKNFILKSKDIRCRARFPIPAIIYKGKNICRSATIQSRKAFSGNSSFLGTSEKDSTFSASNKCSAENADLISERYLNDIRLLKIFSVDLIFDLTVKACKIKPNIYISTNEKDECEFYKDFSILCLPYPGTGFFPNYKNRKSAEGLMFNWNEEFVTKTLVLPSNDLIYFSNMGINFYEYKLWDLHTLTVNYMQVMLKYVVEASSGMVIHCASGWDRTPFFITLLRLSLWADGAIHVSLSPLEILYLTLAYDWYLFGHLFPKRIKEDEEMLFFCMDLLKYLSDEKFSINKKQVNLSQDLSSVECNRAENLEAVRLIFNKLCNKVLSKQ